jgi:cephalosporin hydroxylase
MLVVDAEHTYEAVKAELSAYAGLVVPGGLLVFDDYSARFEGVARAIREHLAADREGYARPVPGSEPARRTEALNRSAPQDAGFLGVAGPGR